MGELIAHALIAGLGLSVYLGFAFVGLSLLNPELWLRDYPPDIQGAWGEMSRRAQVQRWALGLPVLLIAVVYIGFATRGLAGPGGGQPGFPAVWLHTFVMLQVFNVIDLLIIDWLLFVKVQPRFVVLPGTEGLPGYSNYRFHWHAFLKGTAGIAVAAAVVAAIAAIG